MSPGRHSTGAAVDAPRSSGGPAPAPAAAAGRRSRGRRPSRRTTRILILLAVVIAGVLLTRGPLLSYQGAHARLADQRAQVDLIKQQNKALTEQISGLGETSTLEDLARKDLSYARPGERVYTVQGVPDPPASQPEERAPQRGPLESVVSWFRGLF